MSAIDVKKDRKEDVESHNGADDSEQANLNASAAAEINSSINKTPKGSPVESNIVESHSPANDIGLLDRHAQQHRDDEHIWRKQYLQKSFCFVSCILYITFFIVLMVGVGLIDLSDKVLIAILTTTVAHVVGILVVAFHWLYPYSGRKA